MRRENQADIRPASSPEPARNATRHAAPPPRSPNGNASLRTINRIGYKRHRAIAGRIISGTRVQSASRRDYRASFPSFTEELAARSRSGAIIPCGLAIYRKNFNDISIIHPLADIYLLDA